MVWLSRPDWDCFTELFQKVEGTNWYDTREVAFAVLGRFSPEAEAEARKCNENITTILQVILMVTGKTICPTKTHAQQSQEVKVVVDEAEFDHLGHSFKMRHYDDGVWELLDDNDLPIVQGFSNQQEATKSEVRPNV